MILKLLASAVLLLAIFAYRNLHHDYSNDRFLTTKGKSSGFKERTYKTADGSTIAYLEGPGNGPDLLLIHGQMVSKEDYAKVLPALSRDFHVFAVDCYGHGNSSKDPDKYSIRAISDDLTEFMKNVMVEKAYVSGHSSGALIGARIAAINKDQVVGFLPEDGPFFSTEPGRAEKTFAYSEFQVMADFLAQDAVRNYTMYYFDHSAMREQFNKDGKDHWSILVKKPFLKRMKERGGQMPVVWYYPPKMKLNQLVLMTRNLQDKTGAYDLRFGEAFYDFSWFAGFDQEATLKSITCPTLILHVAPPKATAPSYYDDNGVLLSAMDEDDARKVNRLIRGSVLKSGFASDHDIHDDMPKAFLAAVKELKTLAERGQ